MSRPQKIHKPITLDFNSVLGVVARDNGQAKRVAPKAIIKPIQPPNKK
jgi:hypothetical protein